MLDSLRSVKSGYWRYCMVPMPLRKLGQAKQTLPNRGPVPAGHPPARSFREYLPPGGVVGPFATLACGRSAALGRLANGGNGTRHCATWANVGQRGAMPSGAPIIVLAVLTGVIRAVELSEYPEPFGTSVCDGQACSVKRGRAARKALCMGPPVARTMATMLSRIAEGREGHSLITLAIADRQERLLTEVLRPCAALC